MSNSTKLDTLISQLTTTGANKTPKHVIFLGAGASASSGYPLADGLRRSWLASSEGLLLAAEEKLPVSTTLSREAQIQANDASIRQIAAWLERLEIPLQLFRHGGFGTVDEFCYLIKNKRPREVAQLKAALRLVFGLHSPETKFQNSDYYPFIQRLFEPSDLKELRKNVVILSFNYDVYLEWLLRRAVETRLHASFVNPADYSAARLAVDPTVTSGFSGGALGLQRVVEGDDFCLLKLHGMTAWPDHGGVTEQHLSKHVSFEDYFMPSINGRINALIHGGDSDTPIVFPWELFGDGGAFVAGDEFPFKDTISEFRNVKFRHGGRLSSDPSVFEIFRGIWQRARQEVLSAEKISFVGLSMHEYLNWGFQFLFRNRAGIVKLAVTDRVNAQLPKPSRNRSFEAGTTTDRVIKMLNRSCPALQIHDISIRTDFAEFILKEMNPVS